jgi:hypothetical protein
MTLLNLTPSRSASSLEFLPFFEATPQFQTVSPRDPVELQDQAVYLEVKGFRQTARYLFRHDKTLLAYLGLGKRNLDSWPVATLPAGRSTSSVRRNKAAIASRWRQMFIHAQKLYTWELEHLAQAGWPAERLARAAILVEAMIETHYQ